MFIIRRPTAMIDLISNCNQDTAVLMLTFVKLRSRVKCQAYKSKCFI